MKASGADTKVDVVYPRGRPLSLNGARSWLAPALVPASWAYQSLSAAVRAVQMVDEHRPPPGVRVVSIGNLEVGGNGKTPLAVYFLERIAAEGGTPVYVSRAFRSVSERLNAVTVVLPDDFDGPPPLRGGVRFLTRRSPSLAEEIGDEAAMIAARAPGVTLALSRHKRRALDYATEFLDPTHVFLDDAFQSWNTPRDLDVVLLASRRPLGNGRLLPAGTLREAPEALERADVIGFNGVGAWEDVEAAADSLCRQVGIRRLRQPVFGIKRRVAMLSDRGQAEESLRGPIASLSAIGRPEGFEQALLDAGLSLSLAMRYPDHYRYGRDDVEWVFRRLEQNAIDRVVTTEKDWAKLRGLGERCEKFVVARLLLEIVGSDPLEAERAAG